MWQGPGNRGLLVKDGRYLDTAKLNPFIFNVLPFNLTHPKGLCMVISQEDLYLWIKLVVPSIHDCFFEVWSSSGH